MTIAEKLTFIAEEQQTLYDRGHSRGFDYGKQVEYDRFWDAFQNFGNKTSYDCAFGWDNWTDETFQPKYPLRFENTSNAGRQVFSDARQITDIKVPIYVKNTRLVFTFSNCYKLKTIPLLHIEGVTDFNACFGNCSALENITVSGSIDISVGFPQSVKLTKASIESIVNALSDTATGQTLTLSQTAVDAAWGTEDNYGSETAEWGDLCDSKPNWTITLV